MVYKILGDYQKLIAEQKKDTPYFIGIDIGGTNTRVVYATESGDYYTVKEFLCSSISVLMSQLKDIETTMFNGFVSPSWCCIDLAGPHLSANVKKLTNYVADDNLLHVDQLPSLICPVGRTSVLNDLESGAYGIIPFLSKNGIDQVFSTLVKETGKVKDNTSCVYPVLAAGTGLGVGLITQIGDKFRVIPSEFGHISICSDTNDCEQELFKKLQDIIKSKETNRKNYSLEYEDIVSGRGVQALYNIMKKPEEPERNNAEIATHASEDPNNQNCSCVKTMKIHYQYLLRCAREVSVGTFGTSVFLIGDNIVRNSPLVASISKELTNEFLDHPKIEWLENIPVYSQNTLMNLNLIGTIFYAINKNTEEPIKK